MVDEKVIGECTCNSNSHLVTFSLYEIDMGTFPPITELEIGFQLHPFNSVWERVKTSVKYILGIPVEGTHWDNCLLTLDSARKLRSLLDKYLEEESVQDRANT